MALRIVAMDYLMAGGLGPLYLPCIIVTHIADAISYNNIRHILQ